MADIFLGYSRENSEIARRLAARLEREGWSVFWDVRVPTGELWRDVIEGAVREAGCVVVLWSKASVNSRWVKAEADLGIQRGVLVPALIESVTLPFGFAEEQASNLADWDGQTDTAGLEDLIKAIATLVGPRKTVTMWPKDLAIVVGRPKTHGEMAATINLTCTFVNELSRTVAIRWMEASATGPEDCAYHMVWNVLFDTTGLTVGRKEHVRRVDRTARIDVPANATLEMGVQFKAPQVSDLVAWPSGDYTLQIWGWADRGRGGQPANLKTTFRVSVSPADAENIKRLMEAPDAIWVTLTPTDDAIGIPVSIDQVRTGLPAG